jgi:hypothetical protein
MPLFVNVMSFTNNKIDVFETIQKTDQFILNENLQQNVARDFI